MLPGLVSPRLSALAFLLGVLAGCDTPSVPMMVGTDTTRLTVQGHAFTVRHTPQRAESVRTSPMSDPSLRQMLLLSRTAIETASGCLVRDGTLYGDRVMAEAFLDCEGAEPARLQPQWRFSLPG